MKNKFGNSLRILLSEILKKKKAFTDYEDVVLDFLGREKLYTKEGDYFYSGDMATVIGYLSEPKGDYLVVLDTSNYLEFPRVAIILKQGPLIHYLLILREKVQPSEVFTGNNLTGILKMLLDDYFGRLVIRDYGIHINMFPIKRDLRESKRVLMEAVDNQFVNPQDEQKDIQQAQQQTQDQTQQQATGQQQTHTPEEAQQLEDEYKRLLNTQISIPVQELCKDMMDKGFKTNVVFDYTKNDTFKYLQSLKEMFNLDGGKLRDVYPLVIIEFLCDKKYLPVIKTYPFLIIGYSIENNKIVSATYYTPEIKIVLPKFSEALKFISRQLNQERSWGGDSDKKVLETLNVVTINELSKFKAIIKKLDDRYGISSKSNYDAFIESLKTDKQEFNDVKEIFAGSGNFHSDEYLATLVNQRLTALGVKGVSLTVQDSVLPFKFMFLYAYYSNSKELRDRTRASDVLVDLTDMLEDYGKTWKFYGLFDTLLNAKNGRKKLEIVSTDSRLKGSNFWYTFLTALDAYRGNEDIIKKELEAIFSIDDKYKLINEFDTFQTTKLGIRQTKPGAGQRVSYQTPATKPAQTPPVGKTTKTSKETVLDAFDESLNKYKNSWFFTYFEGLKNDDAFTSLLETYYNSIKRKVFSTTWDNVFIYLHGQTNTFEDKLKRIFDVPYPDNLTNFKLFAQRVQQNQQKQAKGIEYIKGYPSINVFITRTYNIDDVKGEKLIKIFEDLTADKLKMYEEFFKNDPEYSKAITKAFQTEPYTFDSICNMLKNGIPLKEEKAKTTSYRNQPPEPATPQAEPTPQPKQKEPEAEFKKLFDAKAPNPHTKFLEDVLAELNKQGEGK
jgi:hypothetical protein